MPRTAAADLAPLVDRLTNRLGAGSLAVPRAVASHVPERAVAFVAAVAEETATRGLGSRICHRARSACCRRPSRSRRSPPCRTIRRCLFRWRHVLHRIAKAEGPERIRPEWWQGQRTARYGGGYARLLPRRDRGRPPLLALSAAASIQPGARARPPRWFLHGIFA